MHSLSLVLTGVLPVLLCVTEMIDVECASDCVSDVDSGCDDGHLS